MEILTRGTVLQDFEGQQVTDKAARAALVIITVSSSLPWYTYALI